MTYAGLQLTPGAVGWTLPGVKQAWTVPLRLLVLLWVLVLFEPDVWLASQGALWARKIPLGLYLLVVAFVVTRALDVPRRVWFLPFLLYIVTGSVTIPFAENTGLAFGLVWKTLLLYYCLAIGTLAYVKSVEKTRLLLVLFLCQFAFWGAQALTSEATLDRTAWQPIPWHPLLSNTDGFAPLMVIGMAFSYYYGMATRAKAMRWAAFVTGFLCVIGMVASFTRGASLAAGIMVLYVLLRSPHRRKALVWIGVVSVVFLIATNVLYPEGEFWARLATITSEGTRAGTGADRWDLWRLGWRVFTERPVFGVGAGNFGVYAFYHIPPDEMLGKYALNHWFIYGRVLHSIHMEILVEFGLVGVATYVWMLVDFWRRNAALRSQRLTAAWARATRGQLDLRSLSLGLEGAMIAFLITGFFYDQLFVHWLYSLLIMNAVLHAAAQRAAKASQPSLAGGTG
ncbi:MAG TPA: O-antigen ligase family protein [Gemmatimonadales bacterium]|nr:O-antigen ligase family protein [Gemmatimonadales bacterium]